VARGRIILNKIGKNKDVNALSSDTSRLLYTWAITNLDRDGRIHGDPTIIRNTVFPRREDVTPAMVRRFVAEWADHDLVILYEVRAEWYLQFPKFRECQIGLRWDREPESDLPPPTSGNDPEVIRKYSGEHPEGIRLKRREEKRREENNEPGDDIFPEVPCTPKNGKPVKMKSAEAAVPSALSSNLDLYHSIEDSFLSQNGGKFTDYAREGKAIKGIEEKCVSRCPEDPSGFAAAMVSAFWALKQGPDKFWRGQPFTPAALNTLGLWDRVLESMRADAPDPRLEQIIKGESRDG
jgi:hypothetical protein